MQDIKTIRQGLRCKVRVMSHSGDDVLTTFDNTATATCVEASDAIGDLWDRCITEHKGHKPTIFGRRTGEVDFDLLAVPDSARPKFDLTPFEEILIQPVPLIGG